MFQNSHISSLGTVNIPKWIGFLRKCEFSLFDEVSIALYGNANEVFICQHSWLTAIAVVIVYGNND
jgi:hypothetical protein